MDSIHVRVFLSASRAQLDGDHLAYSAPSLLGVRYVPVVVGLLSLLGRSQVNATPSIEHALPNVAPSV